VPDVILCQRKTLVSSRHFWADSDVGVLVRVRLVIGTGCRRSALASSSADRRGRGGETYDAV